MVKLLDTGKVKAVGVSNFNIRRLEDLLSKTDVVPAVNQIEAHRRSLGKNKNETNSN